MRPAGNGSVDVILVDVCPGASGVFVRGAEEGAWVNDGEGGGGGGGGRHG